MKRKIKECNCCKSNMDLIQIKKINRNYNLTDNILAIENIKATEVLETFFLCSKCDFQVNVDCVKLELFSIVEHVE